jgi:predicted aspartyl protease
MIRGFLLGPPGRLRPFITARVSIPSQHIVGEVHFLVDTGADSTLLAPRDALNLSLDLTHFPQGPRSTGVGGITTTVTAQATITLDEHSFTIPLRILAPRSTRQRAALARIPSLFGRDLLAHFALFFEVRTATVLLLEPDEADSLQLG